MTLNKIQNFYLFNHIWLENVCFDFVNVSSKFAESDTFSDNFSVKNHETPLPLTACVGLIWPFTILSGKTESSLSLLSEVLSWLTA